MLVGSSAKAFVTGGASIFFEEVPTGSMS